ncbi:MAG: site-specific integrase [Cyanobacteria bacterium J06629_9]
MDITDKLSQVNAKLKAERTRVTIEQKGESLVLRATLPPPPKSTKTKPYQQRIHIGLPASPAGLRQAQREAKLVGAQLATREFDWDRYLGKDTEPEIKSADVWLDEFHRHYIAAGGRETTWAGDYYKPLQRLPTGPLTAEVLKDVVLRTKPNTRSRQRACMAAGALAKYADIDFDPAPLRGNYSPAKVGIRSVPSDERVALHRQALTNPAWRWVYGIMATYGLRNHEVFHLDLTDFPIVRVKEATKTGSREVWPCYPEWAEDWRLDRVELPSVDLERDNSALGHSVTEYLSPRLPFTPYDLRHAWAIRTLEFGWPDALSAQQMGHSLEVHNRTYQRWITTRHHQRVYDLLMNREDRPRPPQVADVRQNSSKQ